MIIDFLKNAMSTENLVMITIKNLQINQISALNTP